MTLTEPEARNVQACFEREKGYKQNCGGGSSVFGYVLAGAVGAALAFTIDALTSGH